MPQFGAVDLLVKKGGHALAYAILAVLSYRATESRGRALFITFLYAISDETHQLWVAGRNGQPLDVLIDTLGGAVGLWLATRNGGTISRMARKWGYAPKETGE